MFLSAALLSACSSLPVPDGKLDPRRTISVSADLAAHDEFPNEWWYYAGRLEDENGIEYAFHVSFFKHWATDERRFGLPVRWVDNPGRFAHGTLTNLSTGKRYAHETVGVQRRGTAGANNDRFHVWTGGWSAQQVPGSDAHLVKAKLKRTGLELKFKPLKPLIVHAGDGTGRPPSVGKSQSYYISSTRMEVSGKLQLPHGEPLSVRGVGWFDHEIMGMDVARGSSGWDWYALQLDDGSELVIYQARRRDGPILDRTMVALVDRDGTRCQLASDEIEITPLDHWTSPRSGARYPVSWKIAIASHGIELSLETAVNESEVRGRFSQITYWEGFIKVEGTRRGRRLTGHGFVELTGYDKSLGDL